MRAFAVIFLMPVLLCLVFRLRNIHRVPNFVGFSVIHVSQGSVATYVMCGGMST